MTLRNAFQILGVVKATFPDMSFDDQSILQVCSQESSAPENVRCLWKSAIELVGSDKHGTNPQELDDDRLLSLIQVNLQGRTVRICMATKVDSS